MVNQELGNLTHPHVHLAENKMSYVDKQTAI
jgi:hypothetical protein